MPRKARRESSTGLYHIIMRGNNRQWIFKKEIYKKIIVNLLIGEEKLYRIELYGWCVMDNHVHIVLWSTKEKLAKAMWSINGKFARVYNYKEQSCGHVFESRYKSEPVEDEAYLLKVIRYVHNNPVKAGIVKNVNDYSWSSYVSYIEGRMSNKMINVFGVYFSDDPKRFKAFHEKTDLNEYLDIKEDITKNRMNHAQLIIEKCCEKYGSISIFELHKNKDIRDRIIVGILSETKLTLTQVANLTGMSYSAIQRMKNGMSE
jgi:REP element-mobilizing transposase RayT